MKNFGRTFKEIKFFYFSIGLLLILSFRNDEWGFYGHRKINYLSVFLLPEEMLGFYKENIFYLSTNATRPDSRRYAIASEGPKHFIDVEDYLVDGFDELPRNLSEALVRFSGWYLNGKKAKILEENAGLTLQVDSLNFYLSEHQVEQLYFYQILPQHQLSEAVVSFTKFETDSLNADNQTWIVQDSLSEKGVNPYHLNFIRKRLTKAFRDQNFDMIIKLSTDIGHYIADNCVPLHTTKNYNGQLTNQLGIHAFWESRIPEILAEEEWDYYFDEIWKIERNNYLDYFINLTESSFSFVDEVLEAELKAREHVPQDKIWCFEERNNILIRTQCEEYARAFERNMKNLAQKQFRQSIHAVASIWYSCWVDAGRPELKSYAIKTDSLEITPVGTIKDKARIHEN